MANTNLSLRIRRELSRCLAGQTSLHQFARWLAPITLATFENAHGEAVELIAEIELRLAEYSNGDWTEEELRRLFRSLVSTYHFSLSPRTIQLVTGTANTTLSTSTSYSVTVADTAHEVVFA